MDRVQDLYRLGPFLQAWHKATVGYSPLSFDVPCRFPFLLSLPDSSTRHPHMDRWKSVNWLGLYQIEWTSWRSLSYTMKSFLSFRNREDLTGGGLVYVTPDVSSGGGGGASGAPAAGDPGHGAALPPTHPAKSHTLTLTRDIRFIHSTSHTIRYHSCTLNFLYERLFHFSKSLVIYKCTYQCRIYGVSCFLNNLIEKKSLYFSCN